MRYSIKYSVWDMYVVFAAGFAFLALEVLGSRMLAPYVGTTAPVWASIISVALLGSSLGYYLGGRFADKKSDRVFVPILLVVAGLLLLAAPSVRAFIPSIVALNTSYSISAMEIAVFLLLIPTLSLSATITYTIRTALTTIETYARVHGDLYAIATLGSICAVFGVSHLLVPHMNTSTIITVIGSVLTVSGSTRLITQSMN